MWVWVETKWEGEDKEDIPLVEQQIVSSSVVRSIRFDSEAQILLLKFTLLLYISIEYLFAHTERDRTHNWFESIRYNS